MLTGKERGLPSFKQRGGRLSTRWAFSTKPTSNKQSRFKTSTALWALVTPEAENNLADAALTAMGISPTIRACKNEEKSGSHTPEWDSSCQYALRMTPQVLRTRHEHA
jgi:hypothetical protein